MDLEITQMAINIPEKEKEITRMLGFHDMGIKIAFFKNWSNTGIFVASLFLFFVYFGFLPF
jgi:hypothetical protein